MHKLIRQYNQSVNLEVCIIYLQDKRHQPVDASL